MKLFKILQFGIYIFMSDKLKYLINTYTIIFTYNIFKLTQFKFSKCNFSPFAP